MKTSQKGIDLIKKFEGCRLTAYKCPAGVWTIGYGHTKDVNIGQIITQVEAEELLKDDLIQYELSVMKYDTVYHWNQNQFDAMVSFAYNIGSIKQLTDNGTRSIGVIADKLLLYNRAAGNELTGLTKRRQQERELFVTPIENVKQEGWKEDQYGWWYQREDGSYPVSCWEEIEGKRYWFNESGYAYCSQWLKYENEWYYLGADCAMVTGLKIIENNVYYFKNQGDMAKEPVTLIPDGNGVLR